jgi:isoquinoline 1-oxidoreductase subunit alpha
VIGDVATRSCLIKAGDAGELPITTLEGLARGEQLRPLQLAWLEAAVTQCGYCQAG